MSLFVGSQNMSVQGRIVLWKWTSHHPCSVCLGSRGKAEAAGTAPGSGHLHRDGDRTKWSWRTWSKTYRKLCSLVMCPTLGAICVTEAIMRSGGDSHSVRWQPGDLSWEPPAEHGLIQPFLQLVPWVSLRRGISAKGISRNDVFQKWSQFSAPWVKILH